MLTDADSMGGLAISADGSVLRDDGSAISGLYAAGEVIGGSCMLVSILIDIYILVGIYLHTQQYADARTR
jgi:predicted oxidoreductase